MNVSENNEREWSGLTCPRESVSESGVEEVGVEDQDLGGNSGSPVELTWW